MSESNLISDFTPQRWVFDPSDSRAEPQPRKGRELQRCSAMKPRAKDNGRLIKDSLWNQFSSSAPYLQKKKVELLSILPDNDAPAEAKEDRIGWRPIHWTSLISQRSAGYSPSGVTREACSYRSTRQCSSGRRGRGPPSSLDRKVIGLKVRRKCRWQSERRTHNSELFESLREYSIAAIGLFNGHKIKMAIPTFKRRS